MNFLNGTLLGGMVLGAVPLLIHLLHKRRFRVVPWGAMHLLDSVLKTNRRRMQLEQVLLLLIRIGIPLFLALAMARPVFKSGGMGVSGNEGLLLVVDHSYSMGAGERPGETLFDRARLEAQELTRTAPQGGVFQGVLLGEGGGILLDRPTHDPGRFLEALKRVTPSAGPADLAAGLQAAAGQLEKLREPVKSVVVLTDFQRASFGTADRAGVRTALDQLRGAGVDPAFVDLGARRGGSLHTDNVAVESVEFGSGLAGVGQKLQFRAAVRSYGETAHPDLGVAFRVDGVEKTVVRVNLGPGQTQQVVFEHVFESAGSHRVEVEGEGDGLAADNRFVACVPVLERVEVLLVNGEPSSQALRGETDFAEVALQPFRAGRMELADLLSARVVPVEKFSGAVLGKAAVVVLANVPKLSDPQLKDLEGFVKSGGGLMVWPGAKLDLDWYRGPFFRDGAGLLPLSFGEIQGEPRDAGRTVNVPPQRFEDSSLDFFNDPRNGSLGDAEIRVWHRLVPGKGGADPGKVLARLETGDPFLVGRNHGAGRVIMAATTLDADWNSFPLRPVYIPLLQRLVLGLASGGEPPRNLKVGATLTSFLPAKDAGRRFDIGLPEGGTAVVEAVARDGKAVLEFRGTRKPGFYTVSGPGLEPQHFAVNASRAESDLTRLSAGELEAFSRENGVRVFENAAAFRKLQRERRVGREIWRPILLGVLALLFGELWFQQRVTGSRVSVRGMEKGVLR